MFTASPPAPSAVLDALDPSFRQLAQSFRRKLAAENKSA